MNRQKASTPRNLRGTATKARLVRAAKAVFEECGFLDARIADIADRAGVSYGSFYHYFDSKLQILCEVARAVGGLLQEPMCAATSDPTGLASPAELVRQLSRRYLTVYRDEARVIAAIEVISRYEPELAAITFGYLEADRARIARAVRRTRTRPCAVADADTEVALLAMSAMMNRYAEMWFVQKLLEIDFDDGVDQLSRLCLNALQLACSVEPGDRSGHEEVIVWP
ncbi:TetR/AcrR family transcriptional regulator [Pseudofrankia inefficax]|uniref:TetR/AcrR family transcriptional regulator n=1 Tax=Pseudofrankia inefficax (strain DSM 45817 / CECT 9037 / DDB 130130 / EuI1c) TaxID=298654 RepID=UPI0002E7E202|nr:TetR/AcrR family transcriptional regulator [Pseudofrankia inefficax]